VYGALSALAIVVACGSAPRDDDAFGGRVTAIRDLRYLGASPNQRVDLLVPRDLAQRPPLVVYVHGGGWMTNRKEEATLALAPYLSAGWAVANVEYRRGFEATAPAAAADVRCAIKWVARRARAYGIDASRLVLAGESAGAHLVMLAAFADSTSGFDDDCPGAMPRIAGVINWAGISDVSDVLAGENARGWAMGWVGFFPGAESRAQVASPIHWVRPGLPAVFTVHGDRDATVPFAQSERLHAALDSAHVTNELLVLRGADHGGISASDAAAAWGGILRFLAQTGGAGPR
jgi:acetyl esterase/lipase